MFLLKQQKTNPNYVHFVYYDQLFSPEECERIKEIGYSKQMYDAHVGEGRVDHKVRQTRTSWISVDLTTQWIYDKVAHNLLATNNKWYNFSISGFEEQFQFAEYTPGSHYKWHADFGSGNFSIRKLSIVIQLTDPQEYTGGELRFFGAPDSPVPKKQGDMIIFPSFEYHMVSPVSSGLRNTLVMWASGPTFI
jgi:PKHD-type hydroxylase